MRILVLLMIFITIQGYAQKKLAEFEIPISVKPYNYFLCQDLTYDNDLQKLSVYGQKWKTGNLIVKKEGKNTGVVNGNARFPFVYVAQISKSGENQIQEQAINLKSYPGNKLSGYDYEGLDPETKDQITSSESANDLGDLMSTFPRAFPTTTSSVTLHNLAAVGEWTGFSLTETRTNYLYKNGESRLIRQNDESKTIRVQTDDDYKIYLDNHVVADNKRRLIIVPAMKGVKKDKLYTYLHKRIYTINKEGKLQHQFDLSLDYPKSLIYAHGMERSEADTLSSFENGAVLIYGRASGVGKKNNDPDETRYHIVIVNKDGALAYEGEFNYGTEKRTLSPTYSFHHGEKIFVFAKTVGRDKPGYAVLTFGKTGLIGIKDYSTESFRPLVVGPYLEGLTSIYGRTFKPAEHYQLANGEILIHGEAYESNFGDAIFVSHVFLRIDAEGNLLNAYVLPKKEHEQKNLTRLNKIYESNGRAYFIGEEHGLEKKRYAVIIKLDYGSGEISKTRLSDFDIFDLKDKIFYKYDELNKQLLVLGRSGDPKRYTVKSAVFELN